MWDIVIAVVGNFVMLVLILAVIVGLSVLVLEKSREFYDRYRAQRVRVWDDWVDDKSSCDSCDDKKTSRTGDNVGLDIEPFAYDPDWDDGWDEALSEYDDLPVVKPRKPRKKSTSIKKTNKRKTTTKKSVKKGQR